MSSIDISNQIETFTKVLCNDGTTEMVGSNPLGGRTDMPCKNKGGQSKNTGIEPLGGGANPNGMYNNKSTNIAPQTFIQKHKNHLLIAGALVLGYFSYKKFVK